MHVFRISAVKMNALKTLVSFLLVSSSGYVCSSNHAEPLHAESNSPKAESTNTSDAGEPLFLTPYIENGDIAKAHSLSKVENLPYAPDVLSYSGFFTVDKKYNSNMFFWFFPAMNNDTTAPVILWLQGGPGGSDLVGVFALNGPYVIRRNGKIYLRPQTWNREFNVLYVDNPVGTGFSFTDDDAGYSTNDDQVADNLYEFLQQFFQVFNEYGENDLYVAGESYGGKYVPSIAYKIHVDGPPAQIKLKGIAIGNGLCDPETQMNYADFFYQLGIIDRKQAEVIRNTSAKAVEDIRNGRFLEAHDKFNSIVHDIPKESNPNYLVEFSGFKYGYNFLQTEQPDDIFYFSIYIQFPEFRKAVHVGNLTFHGSDVVRNHLLGDFMKSVRNRLVPIMNNYKVLIYNGQMDLTLPYTPMTDFLSTVEWDFSREYKEAEQQIWKLDDTDEIAGYVHNVGDFYQVLVRLAGHLVLYDQPDFALDLITRFIKGKPYA